MSKRGYSLERFNSRRLLPAIDLIPGTPVDLKSAATTVLATWYIPFLSPLEDGTTDPLYIRAYGFWGAAAGGAQTTAGTMGLNINGTSLKYTDNVVFVISSVVSHAAGSSVGIECNLVPVASRISTPPSYQAVNPGDIVTAVVVTQGVGAGSQTIYPYLVITEAAGVQQ